MVFCFNKPTPFITRSFSQKTYKWHSIARRAVGCHLRVQSPIYVSCCNWHAIPWFSGPCYIRYTHSKMLPVCGIITSPTIAYSCECAMNIDRWTNCLCIQFFVSKPCIKFLRSWFVRNRYAFQFPAIIFKDIYSWFVRDRCAFQFRVKSFKNI